MILMLYVTSITKGGKIGIFETNTNSRLTLTPSELKLFMSNCNAELKNATLNGEQVQVKEWPHNITYSNGQRYYRGIFLAKVDEETFKVLDTDGVGRHISKDSLIYFIKDNQISNCKCIDSMTSNGDTQYYSTDTYEIKDNPEFREYVDNEYSKFIAKSKLLGQDNRFNYRIEGEEVRIESYKGGNENFIVPNFVTSIGTEAFSYRNLRSIKLNQGLKFIGKRAFAGNEITEVNIPSTVEFVCDEAFTEGEYRLDETNIIFDSIETVMMDWDILEGYKGAR